MTVEVGQVIILLMEDVAVIIEACCRHADTTESDFDFFLFISKTNT